MDRGHTIVLDVIRLARDFYAGNVSILWYLWKEYCKYMVQSYLILSLSSLQCWQLTVIMSAFVGIDRGLGNSNSSIFPTDSGLVVEGHFTKALQRPRIEPWHWIERSASPTEPP